MTPAGLLLCDDLLFASKVTATARAHGLVVTICRDWPRLVAAMEPLPRAVLLDLQHPTLDLSAVAGWRAAGVRVVGFGSHVDAEALRAARAAGVEPAWPRSKFTTELEGSLVGWLS